MLRTLRSVFRTIHYPHTKFSSSINQYFKVQEEDENQEFRRILNIDSKLAQHSLTPLSSEESLSLLEELSLARNSVDLYSIPMISLLKELATNSINWENEEEIARLVTLLHSLKIAQPEIWESMKNTVLVRIKSELLLLQLLKLLSKNNQQKFEIARIEHEYESELKNKHQHYKTVVKVKNFKLPSTFEVIHSKLWLASYIEGFDTELSKHKESYVKQLEDSSFEEYLFQVESTELLLEIMTLKHKNKLKLSSDLLVKIILVIESLCKAKNGCEITNQEFSLFIVPEIKHNPEVMDALQEILTSRAYSDFSITERDVRYLLEMANYLNQSPQVQKVLIYEAHRLNTFILDKLAQFEEEREAKLNQLDAQQSHQNDRVDFDEEQTKIVEDFRSKIKQFLQNVDWGLWRILVVQLLRREVSTQSQGLRMFVSGLRKIIQDPRISVHLAIDDYEEILDCLMEVNTGMDSYDLEFVYRKLHNLKALYTI